MVCGAMIALQSSQQFQLIKESIKNIILSIAFPHTIYISSPITGNIDGR